MDDLLRVFNWFDFWRLVFVVALGMGLAHAFAQLAKLVSPANGPRTEFAWAAMAFILNLFFVATVAWAFGV